jgi:hypothetical protein
MIETPRLRCRAPSSLQASRRREEDRQSKGEPANDKSRTLPAKPSHGELPRYCRTKSTKKGQHPQQFSPVGNGNSNAFHCSSSEDFLRRQNSFLLRSTTSGAAPIDASERNELRPLAEAMDLPTDQLAGLNARA